MCELKLDTVGDGNLIPIRMDKMLFLQNNNDESNKSIKKKCCMPTIIHVYHKSAYVLLQ